MMCAVRPRLCLLYKQCEPQLTLMHQVTHATQLHNGKHNLGTGIPSSGSWVVMHVRHTVAHGCTSDDKART